MEALGASAREITSLVGTIQKISKQTSLLAINAAIESARAGEAGKEFTVVAQQVKELANQSHRSTEVIERQLSAIKDQTEDVHDSVEQTALSMDEINSINSNVHHSIEESVSSQHRAAKEIKNFGNEVSKNGARDCFQFDGNEEVDRRNHEKSKKLLRRTQRHVEQITSC